MLGLGLVLLLLFASNDAASFSVQWQRYALCGVLSGWKWNVASVWYRVSQLTSEIVLWTVLISCYWCVVGIQCWSEAVWW